MLNLGSVYFQYGANTRALDRARKKVTQLGATTNKQFSLMSSAVSRFGGILGGISLGYAAISIGKLSDEYLILQDRLRDATDSQADYNTTTKKLGDIAKSTGVDLQTIVSLYQNVSRSKGEINKSNDDILEFTENISKLGVVGGVSTMNLRQGLTQLSQGISSTELRGEELRAVLEGIPIIGKHIATEMGLTVGKFREMAFEGKVTADVIVDAFLGVDDISDRFENLEDKASRAFSGMGVSFQEMAASFDETFGVNKAAANIFRSMQENFENAAEYYKELDEYGKLTNSNLSKTYKYLNDLMTTGNFEIDLINPIRWVTSYLYEADKYIKKGTILANSAKRDRLGSSQDPNYVTPIENLESPTSKSGAARQKQADKERQEFLNSYNRLSDSLRAKSELLSRTYLEDTNLLEEAHSRELFNEEEFNAQKLALQEKFQKDMADLKDKGGEEISRKDAWRQLLGLDFQKRVDAMSHREKGEHLRDMISQGANYSVETFELNKALDIATALTKAPTAVISAYEYGNKLGGPVLGATFAGLAGAFTAAQISLISQTSYQPPARRYGGGVSANSVYEIGEQGPEIFTSAANNKHYFLSPESGNITPNNKIGTAMPSARQEVIVNVYPIAGTTAEVEEEETGDGKLTIQLRMVETVDNLVAGNLANPSSESRKIANQLFLKR